VYQGRTIFSQLMDFLPMHKFRQSVDRYQGNKGMRTFSCLDQFMCMAFAQLTYRESLRDIECCLRALREKLYHIGIRGKISRTTLADANEKRDWRIYGDFAQGLIHEARQLYADEDFGLELQDTVYALDATIIDLCLSVFPWAWFRTTKSAIKLHTLMDLRGNIPSFIWITHAKWHEVNILYQLVPEAGAIYVMDRGYLDFERLYRLHQGSSFFIVRAKANTGLRRIYSMPVDKSVGIRCDQVVVPIVFYSENAVKTQIWIAISVYVLVAIIKKRLKIDLSLYTILQILSITLFEKMPIIQAFQAFDYNKTITDNSKQLKLF
jgi:hypothetical protein